MYKQIKNLILNENVVYDEDPMFVKEGEVTLYDTLI
jgi:hypothetical protein